MSENENTKDGRLWGIQMWSYICNVVSGFYRVSLSFLVQGLVGVTKSILCDISDNTNQAAGMSTIALSWGSGLVVGPLISGMCSVIIF